MIDNQDQDYLIVKIKNSNKIFDIVFYDWIYLSYSHGKELDKLEIGEDNELMKHVLMTNYGFIISDHPYKQHLFLDVEGKNNN